MDTFEAPNADFENAVKQVLGSMPAAKFLGFEFDTVEPGRVVLRLELRTELCEHQGNFQGGVIGALIDFAGGAACGTMLKPGFLLMTLDYSVKLLRPADCNYLYAESKVLSNSSLISTAEVMVWKEKPGEALCATGLVTTRNFAIPQRSK